MWDLSKIFRFHSLKFRFHFFFWQLKFIKPIWNFTSLLNCFDILEIVGFQIGLCYIIGNICHFRFIWKAKIVWILGNFPLFSVLFLYVWRMNLFFIIFFHTILFLLVSLFHTLLIDMNKELLSMRSYLSASSSSNIFFNLFPVFSE